MGKKVKVGQFLLRSGSFKDMAAVQGAIESGRVRVKERIVHSTDFMFRPSTEQAFLDNSPVMPRQSELYFLFNKPEGVICQKNDSKGRASVWSYLKSKGELSESEINSLVSVGRLDIDTEGLLLLTTDGAFAHRVAEPRHEISKQYFAHIQGMITDDEIGRLEKGIVIVIKQHGERKRFVTKPAIVKLVDRNQKDSRVRITISEGKKRQVRSMFMAVGHKVNYLRRERIGRLVLAGLSLGEIRKLTRQEAELVYR